MRKALIAAQLCEREFVMLVQPSPSFDFHFAASSPKRPRGLNAETSASSL
jgi:hypothetical protein